MEEKKKIPLTKSEYFEKIASKRVQTILKTLRLLSNCANTNNYSYDRNDIRKMFMAIREQMSITESKFRDGLNKKSNQKFKF
jgi:hypothetical protein